MNVTFYMTVIVKGNFVALASIAHRIAHMTLTKVECQYPFVIPRSHSTLLTRYFTTQIVVLCDGVFHHVVLLCVLLCSTVLCCSMMYCDMLRYVNTYVVFCLVVFSCAVGYYVLCCATPCSVVLHCDELRCAVLRCAALCHVILHVHVCYITL